jgi:hypothetical protein
VESEWFLDCGFGEMAVKIAAGAPQANAWTAPVITATVSLPGGVSIGDSGIR